jgi:hypothetical protein
MEERIYLPLAGDSLLSGKIGPVEAGWKINGELYIKTKY